MKVVLLTLQFPPTIGGWSTFSFNYALGLARRGHRIAIIAPRIEGFEGIDDTLSRTGIEVYRLLYQPIMKIKHDIFYSLKSMFVALHSLKEIIEDSDVIHITTEYLGGLFGRILNAIYPDKPIVTTIYGTYSMPKDVWEYQLLRQLYKVSCVIVSISRYTANEFLSSLSTLLKRRL